MNNGNLFKKQPSFLFPFSFSLSLSLYLQNYISMHKYPFCFTFLVSRIFLLLLLPHVSFLFCFVFVPCLLRLTASIWYEIREYLDTDIHTYIHTYIIICAIRLEQCSLCKQTHQQKDTHTSPLFIVVL